jgi:hypothetical protein
VHSGVDGERPGADSGGERRICVIGHPLFLADDAAEPAAHGEAPEDHVHDDRRVVVVVEASQARMADDDVGLGFVGHRVHDALHSLRPGRIRNLDQRGGESAAIRSLGAGRRRPASEGGLGRLTHLLFAHRADHDQHRASGPEMAFVKRRQLVAADLRDGLFGAQRPPGVGVIGRVCRGPKQIRGDLPGVVAVLLDRRQDVATQLLDLVDRKRRRRRTLGDKIEDRREIGGPRLGPDTPRMARRAG